MSLTHEILLSVLKYDPTTGVFIWLKKTCMKVVVGNVAGSVNSDGYRIIGIYGKSYYAHRLAVFYMTGAWPTGLVDHRAGMNDDNRWSELRTCDRSQNAANSKASSKNKSGFKGVSYHAKARKWQAHIYVGGKSKYLGLYASKEEASKAYMQYAGNAYGEFARVS